MKKQNAPAKKAPLKTEEESTYDDAYAAYDIADIDVPPEMDAPPDEEMTGGNVYFDAGYAPKKTTTVQQPVAPTAPTPKASSVKALDTNAPLAAPRSVKQAVRGDAKATFGSFLRSLRKMARNGVLLTLCMDLDSEFEDTLFVLYTTSDTIYRSLQKTDHANLIEKAFLEIGIQTGEYEIRIKGKQSDNFNQNVAELKETFGGVKIDIK